MAKKEDKESSKEEMEGKEKKEKVSVKIIWVIIVTLIIPIIYELGSILYWNSLHDTNFWYIQYKAWFCSLGFTIAFMTILVFICGIVIIFEKHFSDKTGD